MKRTCMKHKITYAKHWYAAKDYIEMKFHARVSRDTSKKTKFANCQRNNKL